MKRLSSRVKEVNSLKSQLAAYGCTEEVPELRPINGALTQYILSGAEARVTADVPSLDRRVILITGDECSVVLQVLSRQGRV